MISQVVAGFVVPATEKPQAARRSGAWELGDWGSHHQKPLEKQVENGSYMWFIDYRTTKNHEELQKTGGFSLDFVGSFCMKNL